jgi:hypothetical protein
MYLAAPRGARPLYVKAKATNPLKNNIFATYHAFANNFAWPITGLLHVYHIDA